MIEISLNKTPKNSKFESKSLKCYFRTLRAEVRPEGVTSVCKALPSVTGGSLARPVHTRDNTLCNL